MRKELKGFTKIFSFTFRQQVCRKGYLTSTILIGLLCLLIPIGALTAAAHFDGSGGSEEKAGAAEYAEEQQETAEKAENAAESLAALKKVLVVNLSEESQFSSAALSETLGDSLNGIEFVDCGEDFEKARKLSKGGDDSLIFLVDRKANEFNMHLLLPEGTSLSEEAVYALEPVFSAYGDMVTGAADSAEEDESASPADTVREILGMLLPYLNIMLLYFFVLFYGQGVAQTVIAEKNSRLMEFFLVSVRPTAMIFGKLCAVCLSGILQLSTWIIGLIGGFAIGAGCARAVNPDTDIALLQVLKSLGDMTEGMFSIGGIILALLMIAAGMLLYCALAGIGGAIAEKPEDLSSTNIMFTLVLVASFFACLMAGGLEGIESGAPWLDWVPFTSIMITPARIMLGGVSLIKGIACFGVVLITAGLLSLLAGKIYKIMALYRGKLPSLKQLAAMLRQS